MKLSVMVALIIIFGLIGRPVLAIDDPLTSAQAYLTAHRSDSPDWAAMALVSAMGSANGLTVSTSLDGTATDLARRILATVAVGQDPSALAAQLDTFVS